jgi:hypothetical protein
MVQSRDEEIWKKLFSNQTFSNPKHKIDTFMLINTLTKLESLTPEVLNSLKQYLKKFDQSMIIWNQFYSKEYSESIKEMMEDLKAKVFRGRELRTLEIENSKASSSFENYIKSIFKSEVDNKPSFDLKAIKIHNQPGSNLLKIKINPSLLGLKGNCVTL